MAELRLMAELNLWAKLRLMVELNIWAELKLQAKLFTPNVELAVSHTYQVA